jgi:hypothetical protein
MKIKLGLEISQAINFLGNFRVIMWFGKIFLGENELKKKCYPCFSGHHSSVQILRYNPTNDILSFSFFKKIRGEWPVVYHLKKKLLA